MNILGFIPFVLYLFGSAWRPLIYAGFLVQSIYLSMRGVELGRLPLVGVHDTLSFLSASIIGFSLPLHRALSRKRSFYTSLGIMAVVFTALSMGFKPHSTPLPPVLKTYWFELHVAMSFFSYAAFGISAILGGLYLREQDLLLERLQYKYIFIGYSLFSASMIFGGIWAFLAWGTYWLWTPKELWTTILWLFYSFYLHARLRQGWAGKPSSVLGIVGFFIVLFTYLGVGLLMKSSHAF